MRRVNGGDMATTMLRIGIAMTAAVVGGCSAVDDVFCDNGNCGWSECESASLSGLADLPAEPPPDLSNKYAENPAAQQLGRKFFNDTRFSGFSNGLDDLARPVPFSRAAKGQPLNISCATCHDLKNGGADTSPLPGNVSMGATWTSVNTPTVLNTVFQPLLMWGARVDSLWAQPPGVIEAAMGSNRAHAAWVVASFYRADYEAIFTEYPIPLQGTMAQLQAMLSTDPARVGQCVMNPDCPSNCRSVKDDTSGATGCFPRFVLDGKPGKKPGCQPGDASEPFGDAFDCMASDDQTAVKRIVVNFAKAIAAFESRLISRNSAFDNFVADVRAGHANDSTVISSDAKQGAKLFVGKAGCADCHNTPLLSDTKFYNVGVADTGPAVPTMADCPKGGVCDCVTPNNCLPWGVRDGLMKLQRHPYLRTSMWSDDQSDLSRKMYIDMAPESVAIGSYRTPSLRDVALTAPYMHDGAIPTLEAVVAHYNRGGDSNVPGDRAARIKPLNLSEQEQAQLVAFLKTLTGEPLPSELADLPDLPR